MFAAVIAFAVLSTPDRGWTAYPSESRRAFVEVRSLEDGKVEASATVSDGPAVATVAYVSSRSAVTLVGECLDGGAAAEMVGLRIPEGTVVWRRRVRPIGDLFVDNLASGRAAIVVGAGRDRLIGLDPESGSRLWTRSLNGLVPVAGNRDLIVIGPVSARGEMSARPSDGDLVAIDRVSGQSRWSYVPPADAVVGGVILGETAAVVSLQRSVPASSQRVLSSTYRGLDLAKGKVLWRRARGDLPKLTRAVVRDTVAALDDEDRVVAVDAEAGELEWESEIRSMGFPGGLAARAGAFTVSELTLTTAATVAIDVDDGSVLWRAQPFLQIVGAGRDVVLAVEPRRGLVALDAMSGARRWVRPLSPGTSGGPIGIRRVIAVGGGCDAPTN